MTSLQKANSVGKLPLKLKAHCTLAEVYAECDMKAEAIGQYEAGLTIAKEIDPKTATSMQSAMDKLK